MARKKSISSGFGLFTANKVQGLTENRASITNVTAAQSTGSIATHVSASYRYDDPGNPLKSTQQLNINWKNFENHTFFNSAEAKVNMAFETIINNYPFDGTVGEIYNFEDSLTGFEKYVLENLPQSTGFLNFNQSQFITVADRAGTLYPSLSKDTTAKAILDPGTGPFAYEMYVYIPENRGGNESDKKQVIAQKVKTNNGITLYTEPTPTAGDSDSETAGSQDSLTHSDIVMLATSGLTGVEGRVSIKRGKWTHISACLDRSPGVNKVQMFVDGKLKTSSEPFEIYDFGFKDQDMTIGKGDNLTAPAGANWSSLSFTQLFSGSIDDFRVFHSSRSESALDSEKDRKVEPRKSLRLNFTFNEPTGSYNNQTVVLDHSGNSLHSRISRNGGAEYDNACRVDGGYGKPMSYEDPSRYPVLFPSHPDLVSYNTDLMVSASNYDTNNPNMITKLVPDHYLREAHFNEGFGEEKELGDSSDPYGFNQDFPGGGKIGSPQIIASLLFIWAKQFDEMKLYLDQFGKVLHADYRDEDTVADTFLPFMAEYFGFELPDMFPNSSGGQFAGREGQGTDKALAKLSLQKIQNTIWRRVLADIREIIRSKGTIHGIKTFLRNVGIDPDRSFRFREYGGSRTGRIGGARQEIKEIGRLLSFSDSLLVDAPGALTGSLPLIVKNRTPGNKTVYTRPIPGDVYSKSPLIISPFLSGTRSEPGMPRSQVRSSDFVLANSSSYRGPSTSFAKISVADGDALHGLTAGQNIMLSDFNGKKVKYFISDTSDGGVAHKGVVNNGDTLKSTGAITATVAAGEVGCAIGFNVGQALPGGIDQSEFLQLLKQSIEGPNGHAGNITVSSVNSNYLKDEGGHKDGAKIVELRQNKNTEATIPDIVENMATVSIVSQFSVGSEGEKILRSGKHVKFGVSPEPSDGLFTSGSWTCEAMYVYGGSHTIGLTQPVTQSLMRMYVTGTVMNSASPFNDPVGIVHKEAAKAKITFSSQPTDGSKITLVDNDTPTSKTFQFDTVAKITIKDTNTATSLGDDVADRRITITPAGITGKRFTFTTGEAATGTLIDADDASNIRVRVKTTGGPNGIAAFNHIADQLVDAINGEKGFPGVLTATRVGNVVSIEPNGMVAPTVTITDNSLVGITATTATGAEIRVPISPRGVEYTTQNLVTQIKAQAALKITPTLLGSSKSIRLVMDDPGTPGTPKIATTGVTNTTMTHFAGGFDDAILRTDSITVQNGRTMLTNLIALSGSDDLQTTGSLVLYARPIPNRPPLIMALTGTDIFDGDRWNICFGRVRNDMTGTFNHVSSSYFLQASKAMGDRLVISNRVEKLFDDHQTSLTSGDASIKLVGTADTDIITVKTDDGLSTTDKKYQFTTTAGASHATGQIISEGESHPKTIAVNIVGKDTNAKKASELAKAILSANGHGTNTRSTGQIVLATQTDNAAVTAMKNAINTASFTIRDVEGNEKTFTFRTDTDETTLGRIGIKSDTTVLGIANSIKSAFDFTLGLNVTANSPVTTTPDEVGDNKSYKIVLTQNTAASESLYNEVITADTALTSGDPPPFTFSNFSGGVTAAFDVRVNDDVVTLTQPSGIPPVLVVGAGSTSTIKLPKQLSAVNLPAFSNKSNINRHGPFLMVGQIDDSANAGKTYGLDCEVDSLRTAIGSDGEHNVNQAAMAQTTIFGGNIGQIRFWSKALTEKEHQEHALNFKSLGVENPAKNYNFVNNVEGSFERLRLDVSMDQETTGSDGLGTILLKDYTQEMFDMEGYAFGDKKQQIFPKTFKYSILSPNFDQSAQSNKVRVRSYIDPAVARRELVDVAPVYHIPKSEKIHDDLRFGIEISITQALNEDIVNILATMDEIENALGAPESQFDVGYLGLENIRDVYFNRLTDKINMSSFFQFFRWFDNTIGGTIDSLVPRKTKFTGVNFIIEPHLLERPKFTYNTADMYLGENNRHGLKGEILLRQLVAMVRRY